jgi:hypothetical protein
VGVVLAISGLTGSDCPAAGLRSVIFPHPARSNADAIRAVRVKVMRSD